MVPRSVIETSTRALAALTLVTAVGGGFAAFGYDLADRLVSWVGWVAGAVGGGAAGWLSLPRVTAVDVQTRLGATVALAVAGAVLGRLLVPLVSRLAVVLAGALATAGAVLVVLAGGQVTNAVVGLDPSSVATLGRLRSLPALAGPQFRESLLIAGAAGLLGGAAAARYYRVIVTGAVTALGAALLGAAVPMWQRAATGGVQFGGGLGRISTLWFAVALAAGVAVQAYRHREAFADDGGPTRRPLQ